MCSFIHGCLTILSQYVCVRVAIVSPLRYGVSSPPADLPCRTSSLASQPSATPDTTLARRHQRYRVQIALWAMHKAWRWQCGVRGGQGALWDEPPVAYFPLWPMVLPVRPGVTTSALLPSAHATCPTALLSMAHSTGLQYQYPCGHSSVHKSTSTT